MSIIKKVKARQVFDSRGNPTVECEIETDDGVFRSIVPSGASKGKHEALELRDNEKAYLGKSVFKAINNVNNIIAPRIIGMDCRDQKRIDEIMIKLDGTENKSNLGANAILSVSMCVARAGAKASNMKLYEYFAYLSNTKDLALPLPFFNVINGGKHAGNNLAIQEFMIVPIGAKSFKEAMQIGTEIYHTLKNIIKEEYGKNAINVGDEGGFAPPLNKSEEALSLLLTAIKKLKYEEKVKIALDAAASEFYKDNKYHIDNKELYSKELKEYYKELIKKYPIISIEDPFAEDDWDSFVSFNKEVNIQIVGDDLLVTNPKRIKKAIELRACNALLLKINQIGTISEAIEAFKLAKEHGWNIMISHRSGDSEDPFIADLSVGLATGEIKSGAPCRSERLAKYNQLLRIEEYANIKIKNVFQNI